MIKVDYSKDEYQGLPKLMKIAYQHLYLYIINIAFELSLFDHLLELKSVLQLVEETSLQEKGLIVLLDSLASMQLLEKKDEKYKVKDEYIRYLTSISDDYIGNYHKRIVQVYKNVPNFIEFIKSGTIVNQSRNNQSPEFYRPIAQTLFTTNITSAFELAGYCKKWVKELIDRENSSQLNILDVAAGSCVWSIPFALLDEKIHVDALDFEIVLEIAREFVDGFNLSGQYSYLCGDIRNIDIEENKYDYILLGNICNSLPIDTINIMLKKAKKSLKDHGKIFIIDMIPEDDRLKPVFPVIFTLLMTLTTTNCTTYTEKEYKEILSLLGYTQFETLKLDSYHSKILLAK